MPSGSFAPYSVVVATPLCTFAVLPSLLSTRLAASRVPHLRDGFIVDKVGSASLLVKWRSGPSRKTRSASLKRAPNLNPNPQTETQIPNPEGPDFSRANNSHREAITALPEAGA